MVDLGKRLTLDIMVDLGFGQKRDLIRHSDAEVLISILEGYNWRVGVYFQCPKLRHLQLEKLVQWMGLGGKSQAVWEKFRDSFTSQVFNDAQDKEEKGAFARFLEAKDPKTDSRIPFQEIWAEGAVWMLAGKACLN